MQNSTSSLIFIAFIFAFLEVSESTFELARLLPNIQFRPVIQYQVGNIRVTPSTVNIIKANGYPVETHYVHTEDGYIIEVHRIPYGRNSLSHSNKLPVILQHGNFQSSVDWVLNSPANQSLGFLLSDNGYDVWMSNQRGNTYSNRHEVFPLNSQKFWNFSFHEIGKFDIPAVIDYVIATTGKPKVHFISFSLGTTSFYTGLALRPEYSSKVALGVTMGPSVFQNNFFNGFAKLVSFSWKIGNMLDNAFGSFPALPHFLANLLHTILPLICNPKLDVLGVCRNVMTLAFGNDGGVIRKEQLPLITSVTPSASGYKAANHIIQLIDSGRFAEYDYKRDKNMEYYGRSTPPDYNLLNVQCPIVIMVGQNDHLAHRLDAKVLAQRLPNLVELYTVPYKHFTHIDFSYGRHEAFSLYRYTINLLNKFN